MKRTIRVEGTGKIKAKADHITLDFRLFTEDKVYEKAMTTSNEHYEKLAKSIVSAGFKRDDLKTKELKVMTKYDQEHDGKIYHQVFKGYEISYHLELSFALDLKKLNHLLGEISKQGSTPEFSISFSVSNDQEFRNEALAMAAQDAKNKAQVLAEAMGVKLGHIKHMGTMESTSGFTSKIQYPTMQMRAMNVDITPQDVENVEIVEITFHIL